MNRRIIFLIFMFGLIVTCLSVKAEDLSKCKTMFDGKCSEYYDTNNVNTDKKCKTMRNGVCTEYFDVSVSSNNYIQEIKTIPANNVNCGNYFGLVFATNDTSHIVMNVLENSSAARNGMSIGNKVIKINENKIKGYETGQSILNRLNLLSTVNIEYKNNNGEKRIVTLSKTNVCIPVPQKEELFETYWKQVFPDQVEIAEVIKRDKALITSRNLDYNDRQFIEKELEKYNYWNNKKQKFLAGYNACRYSNNIENIHICLSSLVNKELQQLAIEQEYVQQQAIFQAQQQMQQQQVNALNNYSNALRNQHVQVDTNVYHSGTVNVNSNVNVNGNYTYRYW